MIKNTAITILSFLLILSVAWHFVPVQVASAQSVATANFQYAYDSESIHEKIDGKLSDTALGNLVYLTVTRNPTYSEKDPNSGEWYIVTLTNN